MTAEGVIALRTIIKETYPLVKMESQEGDEVWYLLLQEYDFEPMQLALLEYIKSGNKFPPSAADLIRLYEFHDPKTNLLLEYMDSKGYFNDPRGTRADIAQFNYENRKRKAMWWIKNRSIPEWLQKDLDKYSIMMQKEWGNKIPIDPKQHLISNK